MSVPLKLFRLGTAAFPVWDGAGAAAQGGRWNPPGMPVIYAAGTLSLANPDLTVNSVLSGNMLDNALLVSSGNM